MNETVSGWWMFTRSIPQGSNLIPALDNIFINDLEAGVECIFTDFAGSSKLECAVDFPEG